VSDSLYEKYVIYQVQLEREGATKLGEKTEPMVFALYITGDEEL